MRRAVEMGWVASVSRSSSHTMRKNSVDEIRLLPSLGVEGDAHAGVTVRHRSRVKADPTQPNLRQVHLLHMELLDQLRQGGFDLAPGQVGENVTTRDVDLLSLPRGTVLWLGREAAIEVTGLRNPCLQLDGIYPGLMKAMLGYDSSGALIRKAGVMGVVREGGVIRPGDTIRIDLPEFPHVPLERV